MEETELIQKARDIVASAIVPGMEGDLDIDCCEVHGPQDFAGRGSGACQSLVWHYPPRNDHDYRECGLTLRTVTYRPVAQTLR